MRFVTGLIYIVIIGLWAVVLIPMWLRRHDQISEVRSAARFSSAMRSLGRGDRPSSVLQMSVPTAREAQEVSMSRPWSRTRDEQEDTWEEEYTADEARDYARQVAATRRAIVMGVLTFVLLLVLILAIMSVLPKWTPFIAALPLLLFIVASLVTAGARAESRVERPARLTRRTMDTTAAARSARSQPSADDFESWDAWEDDEESWDAVPSTLPTYVTAPRASAVPRGIDRAHPGEWTGQAMVDTARAIRTPMSPHDEMVAALAVDEDVTAEIPAVRSKGTAATA